MLHCRFSDVSLLPADKSAKPPHKTGLVLSSSAADLFDGVCDSDQLLPNFQRVTICGDDAGEVCTVYCTITIYCDLFDKTQCTDTQSGYPVPVRYCHVVNSKSKSLWF